MTPVVSGWSGHDLRLGPTLEYAIDLPDRWVFRQTTLVVGTQAEYDVAGDYNTTQCFVDTEGRFPPSVYTGADGSGAADLYCVESLFLREGLIIEPFGGIRESGRSRFGDGDEVRLGGFFQLTTSLPHDMGLVVGGRVDYNITYSPQFSPRLALVAPIAAGFYTKAQFSSGFVYPAFLYRTGNALSDYQGNPDIEPQSIRTVEALIGWKGESTRTELSAYYNDVSRFITYDVAWNARTGEYRFSNQGDLDRGAGGDGPALLSDRLLLDLQATVAHPLSGTSEQFLVDGQLGGPSKYPTFLGRAMISVVPFSRLRLNVDASVSTPVKQAIAPEVRFEGIAGTDGQPYTSRRWLRHPGAERQRAGDVFAGGTVEPGSGGQQPARPAQLPARFGAGAVFRRRAAAGADAQLPVLEAQPEAGQQPGTEVVGRPRTRFQSRRRAPGCRRRSRTGLPVFAARTPAAPPAPVASLATRRAGARWRSRTASPRVR